MIDDFGVGMDGSVPDKSQRGAQKGVKVFNVLKQYNLLNHIQLYQSRKGVQCILLNINNELKNFNF